MYIILETLAVGLMMGIVFGFSLEKARVFEPGMIIGQLQFRNFIMLKVFLTAVATGLVIFTLFQVGGFEKLDWRVTIYKADIIGGLFLGAGIALAGSCPGTVFAQLGVGYRDALFTLAGALLGAFTFTQLQGYFQTALLSGEPHAKLTLDSVLGLPYWVTALGLVFTIVVLLFLLESYRTWRDDLGQTYDGLK